MTSPLVTLWIGPQLGPLERACFRSALRQGHRLILYCYERPVGVPEGVEVVDAASVLPEGEIIQYENGSYALFSNRFRYELQRRGLGIWIDADVYFLKPLEDAAPYIIGEQAPGEFNTAVLRMPPDSPLLPALLKLFDGRTIPRWIPGNERRRQWWRRIRTGRTDLASMPWGTTGPYGLTATINASGVDVEPQPPEVFYPVPWQEAAWIADPEQQLEQRVTARTVAIHLWNSQIDHLKKLPAPAGSFLARLGAEGA